MGRVADISEVYVKEKKMRSFFSRFAFVTILSLGFILNQSFAATLYPKKQKVVRKKSSVSVKKNQATTPKESITGKAATTPPDSSVQNAPQKENEGDSAKVISVKQKVETKSADQTTWKKATDKTTLNSSDKIRTGSKSLAKVRMENGTTVLLLQNSEAEMENLSSVQRTIKLLKGKVRAIVTKLKSAGSFKIKTPIGVASVRGTEFEVEFSEEDQKMQVDVLQGQVGVSKLGDLAEEVILNPGEKIQFGVEGDIGDPIKAGAVPLNREDVHAEVQIDRVKEGIVAMAAEESRNADYQTGKSLIDVDGKRVRVEQYIMRPASNQFKLVSLNKRENRFDYFTYKGTFNKTLPDDLSVALGQIGGKLGTTAPDYYLTDYEMLMSNTKDTITDSGSGGHLVKIELIGGNYILTDNADSSNTKTVAAATLQSDGSYKIYNPIKDTFSLVSAANLTEAQKISVLDSGTGEYRNLASGDTYWKGRYDSSSYFINTTAKTSFAKKSAINHVLAVDLDATFTNPAITTISEYPSGTGTLYNKLSLFYSDGSKTEFNNYIIDDDGKVASSTDFSGLTTSAAYKNQLEKWNYQQKVKSTEMSDEINLVIDPRIGTVSGLIQ